MNSNWPFFVTDSQVLLVKLYCDRVSFVVSQNYRSSHHPLGGKAKNYKLCCVVLCVGDWVQYLMWHTVLLLSWAVWLLLPQTEDSSTSVHTTNDPRNCLGLVTQHLVAKPNWGSRSYFQKNEQDRTRQIRTGTHTSEIKEIGAWKEVWRYVEWHAKDKTRQDTSQKEEEDDYWWRKTLLLLLLLLWW